MKCPSLNDLPPPPSGKTGWPWTEDSLESKIEKSYSKKIPKISIVTPSFNQGIYIEETIRSVLLQGYPDIEYIIMDGGSNDNTVQIIQKYSKWLTYWQSEKDKGQSEAINNGFTKASGKIYYYINSDDVLEKNILAKIIELYDEIDTNNYLIALGGADWNSEINQTTKIHHPAQPNLLTWLTTDTSLFQPSTFWSSELHSKLLGFNEEMRFCFDKDFFLRAIFIQNTKLIRNNEIGSKFRLHPASKTSTLDDIKIKENNDLFNKYKFHPQLRRQYTNQKNSYTAEILLGNYFITSSLLQKIKILISSASKCPDIVFTRFYIGAILKLFN